VVGGAVHGIGREQYIMSFWRAVWLSWGTVYFPAPFPALGPPGVVGPFTPAERRGLCTLIASRIVGASRELIVPGLTSLFRAFEWEGHSAAPCAGVVAPR